MHSIIYMSNGNVQEGKTRYRSGTGAIPRADEVTATPGESIASITERAYGANTPGNRQKINNANSNLDGQIRIPR
jgi:hypothetical protein